MTKFDAHTLNHLKKLCRLDCSPEEGEEILSSLQKILDSMEELNEVNTDNVAPCNFVLRAMGGLKVREDLPGEVLPRDTFLSNCPDQVGGMVKVPPVLKEA